jgi:hypothetical protein
VPRNPGLQGRTTNSSLPHKCGVPYPSGTPHLCGRTGCQKKFVLHPGFRTQSLRDWQSSKPDLRPVKPSHPFSDLMLNMTRREWFNPIAAVAGTGGNGGNTGSEGLAALGDIQRFTHPASGQTRWLPPKISISVCSVASCLRPTAVLSSNAHQENDKPATSRFVLLRETRLNQACQAAGFPK